MTFLAHHCLLYNGAHRTPRELPLIGEVKFKRHGEPCRVCIENQMGISLEKTYLREGRAKAIRRPLLAPLFGINANKIDVAI